MVLMRRWFMAAAACALALLCVAACGKEAEMKPSVTQIVSPPELVKPTEHDIASLTFDYDRESGAVRDNVRAGISNVTADGADLSIAKRTVVDNGWYEKTYRLTNDDLLELQAIVNACDLYSWRDLGRNSTAATPYEDGTFRLEFKDGTYVYADSLTKYPEGNEHEPPIQETVIALLYNYLNGFVSADPDMEDVHTDMRPLPAERDLWQDRSVIFRGRLVHLVPGTGTDGGEGATIVMDEGTVWWADEGLVGHWVMTDEDRALMRARGELNEYGNAELWIEQDGSIRLVVDGTAYVGACSPKRRYVSAAEGDVEAEGEYFSWRSITMDYVTYNNDQIYGYNITDYRTSDHLEVRTGSRPYPDVIYPLHLLLTRGE